MLTVTLPITKVEAGLPDADTDVIVFLEDGRSDLGAIDATGWVDCTGMTFAHRGERVVAWSEFPTLPAEVLRERTAAREAVEPTPG